ncbi:MAG: hypothetical protein WDM81_19765 [Rhizomicrobium sp.]
MGGRRPEGRGAARPALERCGAAQPGEREEAMRAAVAYSLANDEASLDRCATISVRR